jgi:Fe-S-cluster containining protein
MPFDEIISRLPESKQVIIRRIMSLFNDFERQTKKFSTLTGLCCKEGCGACCENPRIESTITEVLPLAVHLHSNKTADEILRQIRSKTSKKVCVFYKPNLFHQGQGRCSIYAYRPGLCRLFGYSTHQDKHGKKELVTCKVIKESLPKVVSDVNLGLQEGLEVPSLTQHAFAVADIDPNLGAVLLPINEAVALAIEKIGYFLEKSSKKV